MLRVLYRFTKYHRLLCQLHCNYMMQDILQNQLCQLKATSGLNGIKKPLLENFL